MNDKSTSDWFGYIGNIRDGLIVLVSAVYVIGYLVWSFIAWKYNLGPLPVLDAQYFAAGTVPALTVCIVILISRLLKTLFILKWPDWLEKRGIKAHISILSVIIASMYSAFILIALVDRIVIGDRAQTILYIASGFVIILCVLLMEHDPFWKLRDKLKKKYPQHPSVILLEHMFAIMESLPGFGFLRPKRGKPWRIYLIPSLAAFIAIFFYIQVGYFRVPQELGGARPRLAEIDLLTEKFSPETLKILLPDIRTTSNSKVVRSREILVYYFGRNSLLLGVVDNSDQKEKRLEVSIDTIKAIVWHKEREVEKKEANKTNAADAKSRAAD